LDTRRFPKGAIDPESEFYRLLARFPSLGAQFANAKAVRPWISTDRVQYSSKKCFGDRYCLLAHASAFVDPLFSRGLANNAEVINSLAGRLLEAFAKRDFSAKPFEYVERLQQSLYDYNDRLVNCAYVSFSDFELWRAWYRVWAVGSILGGFRLNRAFCKYLESGDTSYLCLDNAEYPGLMCPDMEAFKLLFESTAAEVDAVEAGRVLPGVAATRILQLLEETDFAPALLRSGFFRFKTSRWNLVSKYYPTSLLKLLAWGKLGAPAEIKSKYFDYGTRPMAHLCYSYFREKSPIV
jgi:FADH2 O2-dependent halogenase